MTGSTWSAEDIGVGSIPLARACILVERRIKCICKHTGKVVSHHNQWREEQKSGSYVNGEECFFKGSMSELRPEGCEGVLAMW